MIKKNWGIYLVLAAILVIPIGCKHKQVTDNPNNNQNTVSSGQNTVEDEALTKEYSQEGFISADSFRVIIIQTPESTIDEAGIKNMAENRANASLKKFIQSNGGTINTQTDAQLNIIVQSGKIKKIIGKKRILYVFEINSPNLKRNVDNLGKAR